jgi:hypothetical protein
MPRYWVGPRAGVEWLLRFFPLWLQVGDFLLVTMLPWHLMSYGVAAYIAQLLLTWPASPTETARRKQYA